MWYDLKITWYKKDKREKKTLKSLHKRKQIIFINLSNNRLRDVWVLRWLSMNNPVSLASMSVTASHLTTRCFFFFSIAAGHSWSWNTYGTTAESFDAWVRLYLFTLGLVGFCLVWKGYSKDNTSFYKIYPRECSGRTTEPFKEAPFSRNHDTITRKRNFFTCAMFQTVVFCKYATHFPVFCCPYPNWFQARFC